jgi:molecular chaperone Hsp33
VLFSLAFRGPCMATTVNALETNSPASDELIRFLLPAAQTRGAIIRASHLRAEACRIHGLVESDRHAPGELFAQTLIASILLLSISKGGVRQVLQLDGSHGPMRRILAETRGGTVRGYVDWNEGVSTHGNSDSPISWLGSPVTLSTVRDPGFGQPYISSVHSACEYLADMLVDYMTQSVQIRADVLLHRDTGLLIEAMPGCGEEEWFSAVRAMAAIPDAALDRDPEQVLEGFDSLGMQIVGRNAYRWYCGCDSGKMARALAGMPAQTLETLKDEQGRITVSCRYCGASHSIKTKQQ